VVAPFTKETVDKHGAKAANRGRTVNALKYLSLGLLLLLAGCASNDNSKRASGQPWYAPNVDAEDRTFFYDSFLH
jgi:hypothetical protein